MVGRKASEALRCSSHQIGKWQALNFYHPPGQGKVDCLRGVGGHDIYQGVAYGFYSISVSSHRNTH